MVSLMDKFDFLVTGDCKLRMMKEVDIESGREAARYNKRFNHAKPRIIVSL